MNMDRIAAIADIHGNTWALDAVLADMRGRGITTIVNLGDCVYGSIDPAGTIERLMADDMYTIMGNQDRDAFAPSEPMRRSADYPFVTSRLSATQIDWLVGLPPTLVLGGVFCCHGTPPNADKRGLLDTNA